MNMHYHKVTLPTHCYRFIGAIAPHSFSQCKAETLQLVSIVLKLFNRYLRIGTVQGAKQINLTID